MTTLTGWAASSIDPSGEWYDIDAGWDSREKAVNELKEQGADMTTIEIYPATSSNGWETWEPQ